MALIGYARVSTVKQNLDPQIKSLLDEGVLKKNIYTEKKSGSNIDRPVFKEMMKTLKENDILIVFSLDRLGRSLIDLVNIINTLNEKGVSFRTINNDNIDTTTATGKMLFQIMAVLAEYEAELRRERVSNGIRNAKEEGRIGGRPKTKPSDPKVLQVKHYIAEGKDRNEICKLLNISNTTFYKYKKL